MAASAELKRLVDQLPAADARGMYTTDIDKDKIDKAVAAIFAGGKANVQGMIDMLGEPGTDENVKPHYGLHCVLNHALVVGDEKAQKEFCDTLAANLSKDSAGSAESWNGCCAEDFLWPVHRKVSNACAIHRAPFQPFEKSIGRHQQLVCIVQAAAKPGSYQRSSHTFFKTLVCKLYFGFRSLHDCLLVRGGMANCRYRQA